MNYEKQTFKDGQVLTAECLNRMENGIKGACDAVPPACPTSDCSKVLSYGENGPEWVDMPSGGGGTGGGGSVDDTKISSTAPWSSRKTAREIFCDQIDVRWENGGLQSVNGVENTLMNRMRTGFIDVTKPYMLVDFDSTVQIYAYFYSNKEHGGYIGASGAWLTTPFILTDIVPNGTRFVRFGAKLASDATITDANLASSGIDIRLMRGIVENPYTDYQSDVPENIGVLNAILNFKQLAEVKYTTKAKLPSQVGDFAAGKEYVGLPYSSSRPEAGFVPNFVSLYTFMTALQNPNSYLYTVDLGELGNDNGDTYYGAVCSTSCGYALNIVPNYSTHQWKDVPGMFALDWQSVHALKLGDMISSRVSGHIVMVTDITRNKRGRIGEITITEAAPPRVVSTTYTPDALAERFPTKDFVYFRYDKIHEVTHVQSPFVAVEDEAPQTVAYNTALIPRKGDKANWLMGVPVEIDILESGRYTDVEIHKDNEPFDTVSLYSTSTYGSTESVEIDRTVYGLEWEIGGINSADGAHNGLTTRAKTQMIPSTDLKIILPDNMKVSLFFYDSTGTYISSSGFVPDNGAVLVKDYAPENATFVIPLIAYDDNANINDLNGMTSQVSVETATNVVPILFKLGGLSSETGEHLSQGRRVRSSFLPLQNYKIGVSNDAQYVVYYYNTNGDYISCDAEWKTGETEVLKVAPEGTDSIRILMRKPDDSDLTLSIRNMSLKITLTILGGMSSESDEKLNMLALADLDYGSYKARLTDGTDHSDWCYWMVVDAQSTATPTGNPGEIEVTFDASNAVPLFVGWNHGTNNGTVHISIPTDGELAEGKAVCSHEAGSFKVRVAFQTEYGIIHSALPEAITVT